MFCFELLDQFPPPALLAECLCCILQEAKDLRARLHRGSELRNFSPHCASEISGVDIFTAPRLGDFAGGPSPLRALESGVSSPPEAGHALLDLVSEYGQPDSDPEFGDPEPCRSAASDSGHDVPDSPARPALAEEPKMGAGENDVRLMHRQIGRLQTENRQLESEVHLLEDELAQSKAEAARLRRHTEIRIGIELSKVNPNISGFENGKVVYKPPPQTPRQKADATYFRLFGTHKSVGPGPYANGSWQEYGKQNKPLTHEFVFKYINERDAEIKAREQARHEAARLRDEEIGLTPDMSYGEKVSREQAYRRRLYRQWEADAHQ